MARITRIAVNLLLIVAITMQPAMVLALSAGCSPACTSQFTCQGCGGCEVESPGDHCGCCCGHSDEEIASCCGHGSEKEPITASTSEDESFAQLEIDDVVMPDEWPSCCADENLEGSSPSPAMDSSCHCFQAPKTPYAPASRSPANEIRDLEVLGFAPSVLVKPKEHLPRVPEFRYGRSSAKLHFAQIALCVWRL